MKQQTRKKISLFFILLKTWYIEEIIIGILIIIMLIYKFLNFEILIRAIIIFSIMLSYKWLGHKVGIDRGYAIFGAINNGYIRESYNKKKLEWYLTQLIHLSFCIKYSIIFDVIFWLFFLLPWIWLNFIYGWLGVKFHDMIIRIASNRDIYYKKHYNKDVTGENWGVHQWKYWYVIQWVMIYPVLRLLLLPRKIRVNIFGYKNYLELLKIRIIVYCYSLVYLYVGYYEFVTTLWIGYKLLVVYVYLAIIWPYIIDWQCKLGNFKDGNFYEPTLKTLLESTSESISFHLFGNYVAVVNEWKNSYIYLKYGFNLINSYIGYTLWWEKINFKEGIGPNTDKIWRRWTGEKTYGVSVICFGRLCMMTLIFIPNYMLFLYNHGIKELGLERMKKYEVSLEKLKVLYKINVILFMDIRRLCGYPKEKWLLWPREYKDEEDEEVDFAKMEKEISQNVYKLVPNEYQWSLKFYNKLLKIVVLLPQLQSSVSELNYSDKGMRYLVFDIVQNKVPTINYKTFEAECESLQECSEYVEKLNKEEYEFYELRKKGILEQYDYKFFEDLCQECLNEYEEEYKKMTSKEELVGEKYIKNYISKYVK